MCGMITAYIYSCIYVSIYIYKTKQWSPLEHSIGTKDRPDYLVSERRDTCVCVGICSRALGFICYPGMYGKAHM